MIEDRQQQWGKEFSFLATSISEKGSLNREADMIQARYSIVQRNSPEYDNLDQSVSLHFDTLHLHCNRETVMLLMQFTNSIRQEIR